MRWNYVPMLAARQAEWETLERLPRHCDGVLPLVSLAPPAADHRIPTFFKKAALHWDDRPLMIDGHDYAVAERAPVAGRLYQYLADMSQVAGITSLPVVSPDDWDETVGAAAALTAHVGAGAAIRLRDDDLHLVTRDTGLLRRRLDRLLTSLRLAPADIELVIDLGQIGPPDPGRPPVAGLQHLLPLLPHLQEWRTIVLAGTSAPAVLDDRFNAPPLSDPIPRQEWQVWSSLRNLDLPRHAVFGDYAGFAAAPPTGHGRTRHPWLRYSTTDGRQLISRRRSLSGEGFKRFVDVCQDVIASPHFAGAAFSWGDRQIQTTAEGRNGTGTAQTWREIALDHHIRTVLHQLATPARPGAAAGQANPSPAARTLSPLE